NGNAVHEIFSTSMQSSIAQTIIIAINGDDGHSLFVDGVFRGGGGFASTPTFNLSFTPGQIHQVTVAGYNGPANWVFDIGVAISVPLPGSNPQFSSTLENVPGIRLNADGIFPAATVPEPASWLLFGSLTC